MEDPAARQLLADVVHRSASGSEANGLLEMLGGMIDSTSGGIVPVNDAAFAFGTSLGAGVFRRDNGQGLALSNGGTWDQIDDLHFSLDDQGALSVQRVLTDTWRDAIVVL